MPAIDRMDGSEGVVTPAESPAFTSSSTGPTPGVLDWSAAFGAGVEVTGGKGWHLSRLARYGFRVPRGGVVPAGVYRTLCRHRPVAEAIADLGDVSADRTTDEDVRRRLDALRAALTALRLPEDVRTDLARFLRGAGLADRPVAVRSSAVAEDAAGTAFAGIHDSTLDVVGLDAVCAAVLRCYASLWSPHALAYRRRFGVADADTPCAVVVCEMVRAEVAGVAFSCDPVTGRRGVVTIDLAAGSGEAVVSGAVDPQQYMVEWPGPEPRVRRTDATGEGAVLDPPRVAALAQLVRRVHWALGDGDRPQDVEWAWAGARFWLLQSRPVTRLPRWTFPGVPAGPAMWSDANIRDSFPRPVTTMTWSFLAAAAQPIVYASVAAVRYPLPAGMEVLRRYGGRPYFDLDSLQWSFYDALGILPAEVNRQMGGFQREVRVPAGNPMRGRAGLGRARRRLRLLRRLWGLHRTLPREIDALVDAARAGRDRDVSTLDDAGLLAAFREQQARGADYQPLLQLAASYYGTWMTLMQDVLEWATGDRGQTLVGRLLAASGNVASAEHGLDLRDLGRLARDEPRALDALRETGDPFAWRRVLPAGSPFRLALERYLDRYGHRGVFEMEFASRRWWEDPSYLLDQIRFHAGHPEAPDPRGRARERRDDAEAGLADVPACVRPLVRWLLGRTRLGAALRENAKSGAAAAVDGVRSICLEAGRRLHAAGRLAAADDVFHLGLAEVEAFLDGSWDGAGADRLVEDRGARFAAQHGLDLPGVIDGDDGRPSPSTPLAAPPAAEPPDAAPGGEWQGVAAAPGVAAGPARVLRDPHDGAGMARGDVLVAPSTDPGWTPLFLRASAVVMETGGYLSHGAVVARELGLPAVVNVPDAMRRIGAGDRLRVDGDRGRVIRFGGSGPAG